jgi:hypothetical protein
MKQTKLYLFYLSFISLLIVACSSNPFSTAQTISQKAYAVEASYNILLEQAVEIGSKPTTPPDVVDKIISAQEKATPIVVSLSEAARDYADAKSRLSAGVTTADKVLILAENLESWTLQAEEAIASFKAILE